METSELTDLLRRHAGLIHKVAYAYCRDATDREDVVQEVAVQLWRSRDRYDRRFAETTWVYRIALNVAISFHRRERRHREKRRSIEEASAITIVSGPASAPGEDIEGLMACVDDLGDLEKALVLLWLDGNDHATVASVLGISVSNVGTKLHRVKEKLRVAFERRESAREKESPRASR